MAEKTSEQIEKEKSELREKKRSVALKNLESSMWGYAAPKFITSAQYGELAKYGELSYQELIGKTPDQHVYEQIFLPQLANEGGAITSPYIQNTSAAIIQESLASIKVADILKYIGVKGDLKDSYKDKYINQIKEEEAGTLIGSAIQYQTDEKVKGILGLRQKGMSSELEKMLIQEKPKEEPKK